VGTRKELDGLLRNTDEHVHWIEVVANLRDVPNWEKPYIDYKLDDSTGTIIARQWKRDKSWQTLRDSLPKPE
jgi:hypothetical protein